jgi:hypothetical protein
MFRLTAFILLALLATAAAPAASCAGADPGIVSVSVAGVQPSGGLNNYHITGTVTNLGGSPQAKNVLQSVDVYMASEKLDAKSIPPLAPGQSYNFNYTYQRSRDAGNGTTILRFVLDMHGAPDNQDCNTGNDSNQVRF